MRYRTKDLTSLMEGECPCGRTNIRMSGIVGRSDDMLSMRGINVFPSQVESVILDMPQFEPQYMLVVDRKNNLCLLYTSDKEAIRVISSMPKWKPGKQRGKAVRVKYTVPVVFRLQS